MYVVFSVSLLASRLLLTNRSRTLFIVLAAFDYVVNVILLKGSFNDNEVILGRSDNEQYFGEAQLTSSSKG
jgi:hypothetical protein